ncbi:MAG: hypothetical protein ACREEM_07820 [Blastocatellia bacterium]
MNNALFRDEVATALGNLSGLPGLPFQHLRYFKLAACEGAPVLASFGLYWQPAGSSAPPRPRE